MRRTAKHATRHTLPGRLAVVIIVALSIVLFFNNIRINKYTFVSNDLGQLISQRAKQADVLHKELNSLSDKINSVNMVNANIPQSHSEDAGSNTVVPEVQGPGVQVTLNDSPLWKNAINNSGTSTNINDYVIHQQDIEAVINALWRGGAEVMAIQKQRILTNSAVICKGNILMIQGKRFSPPFIIEAIGPVKSMMKALQDSSTLQEYREYARVFGLGWKVNTLDKLSIESAPTTLQQLQYAQVSNTGRNHS